jgi:hypothetical protein
MTLGRAFTAGSCRGGDEFPVRLPIGLSRLSVDADRGICIWENAVRAGLIGTHDGVDLVDG